jgi:hypothetical protein
MQGDRMGRREHPRFQIKEHAFVVLDRQSSRLGEIVDICLGGVAVRYLVGADGQLGDTRQIDIMMGINNFYLEQVPVTKVADRLEKEAFFMATTVTRIAVLVFGDLTSEQKCSLSSFISRHADCQQPPGQVQTDLLPSSLLGASF